MKIAMRKKIWLLPAVLAGLLVVCGVGSMLLTWLQTRLPACPAWLFWPLWLAPMFSIMFSYQTERPRLRSALHRVGECWLGVFLYLSLAFIARWLLLRVAPDDPRLFVRSGWWALAAFAAVYAAGVLNALQIRIRRYQLRLPLARACRLALVSDLHLGFFTGPGLLGRLVQKAREADPDAVLIAGDIFDMEYEALRHPDERRAQLAALPQPVYACLGNHDLLSDDPRKERFIREAGIQLLKDEWVELGPLLLLGRRDLNDERRLRDAEIYAQCGRPQDGLEHCDAQPQCGRPLVVLDHEPFAYEQNWAQGADLVLSGHTHGGQTFPGNLVFRLLKTPAYGYRARGRHQLIVTSGLGFWGPPLRLGVNNELVVIDLLPEETKQN